MRLSKHLIACTLLACTAVPSLGKSHKAKPAKKTKHPVAAAVPAVTADSMSAQPTDEIAAPPVDNSDPIDVDESATPPPTLTPYVAFAWSAPPTALNHVVGTVWYTRDSDPAQIAAALKALPEGERALLHWQPLTNLLGSPNDPIVGPDGKTYWGPWLDNGAQAESTFQDQFMGALQQQGATVNYLVLDTEWSISNWSISQGQLNAITADPRWSALADTFGITRTDDFSDTSLNGDSEVFNLAMQVTIGGYMHAAYDTPMLNHFPDAHCSDYGDQLLSPATAPQCPDYNGWCQVTAMPLHGDTQAPAYYSQIGSLPAIDGEGADFSKPMAVLCYQVSCIRALAQADVPIIPWLCGKTWTGCLLQNSPYYDELVYHLMLSGGTLNLNLWNPDPTTTQADCAALDADLAQAQLMLANAQTITPVTTDAVPYGSSVLVSGATCPSGRRVYRITVGTLSQQDQTIQLVLPGETATTSVTIPAGAAGQWLVR